MCELSLLASMIGLISFLSLQVKKSELTLFLNIFNQYLSKEWNKVDHKIEALNLGFRRAIETGGWRDA